MSEENIGAGALLLRGARVVGPDAVLDQTRVLVVGERITQLYAADETEGASDARALDLTGLTLYPGFIDVHIHGAVGVDTMTADAAGLHKVARFLTTQGVTVWLPTFVPGPPEDYARAVAAVAQLRAEARAREPAARAVGVHYEGPFVNRAQCGALRPAYFRTFQNAADIADLPTVSGAARMTTVAPEIEGGVALVRELAARGWVVSIGHTRAEVATLDAAAAAGARHMTHFFNAMSPLHHRAPGPVGWGLLRDDVTCDVVADGVHADPLALRLALRCKTSARLLLVSDAVAPTGLGDGEYELWGERVAVAGGRTRNERGSIAGSVSTVRDGVRMMRSLGASAVEIARLTAHNPAALLGLTHECGTIAAGQRADLTALDDAGRVRLTIVGGRVAFSDL
ncbi:MAG TPA: N-acetylglucosamine-6-phosphate deacetylase [Pyrinomonadaceae bacterium]|jgi:N-acetylglucosamine-6-phosphate deacetylase